MKLFQKEDNAMKRIFLLILCVLITLTSLLTTSFASTSVSEFDFYVAEPVPGEKAEYNVTVPAGACYSVTNVKWIGVFDAGKTFSSDYDYTIQFTVRINDDFDGHIEKSKRIVRINGEEARLYGISEDQKEATVSRLFKITPQEELPFENAIPVSDEELYEEEENDIEITYIPDIFLNFKDVPGDAYYAEAVKWAIEKNITAGTSSTTFSPDEICTRAEIITFLWRAAGSPEPLSGNVFSDVTTEDYYYKAAIWASENDMVTGKEFKGATPCTRASTVVYLWKYAGSPDAQYDNKFADVSINDPWSGAVAWALNEKVTAGTSDTTFSPDMICTRGQIVTFLNRAFK